MKHNQLFDGNTRILRNETPLDFIKEIAACPDQDKPFYVFDAGDLVHKIKNWKMKLPRVKPFYSVRCNHDTSLLKVLAAIGIGFDCRSKGEMQKIIELGVNPSRIIFAHPVKRESQLICANSLGVQLMTFCKESELRKIKEITPNAKLVLQISCDAVNAKRPLGMKFGALPEDSRYLLQIAQDLGLDIVGVSFHVGCEDQQIFRRAIKLSKEVFDQATKMGFKPYLLDIGGGYPGGSTSTLNECAKYINSALEDYFPEELGIEIIAEPGRYFVTSAFTIATKITTKKIVHNKNGDIVATMYILNDGVYGSFNGILHDDQVVSPETLKDTSKTTKILSSLWGPTCDGLDRILEAIPLPSMNVGDWLVWYDMGAYTLSSITNFNGFFIPLVHTAVPLHTWVFLEDFLGHGLNGNKDRIFDKDWCCVMRSGE